MKKLLLLLIAVIITYFAKAQYPYHYDRTADKPPKNMVKFSYDDGDRHVKLDSTNIDLLLHDRFCRLGFAPTFDVMLSIKNTSKRNIYVPRHINCFEDNGFGSDRYFIEQSDVVAPGKTKKVPVHVYETRREWMRKEGFIVLFTSDSTAVNYPIRLKVHYVEKDTTTKGG